MKGKKKLAMIIAAVMIMTAFTGCGGGDSGGGGGVEENGYDPIQVIVAHTDTSQRSVHVWSEWLGEWLEEQAPGRFIVDVFPDGQLGDSPDIYSGILLGTVQMGFEMSTVLATQAGSEAASVVDLPYLYPSIDDWITGMLYNGGLELYNEALNAAGYHCVDLYYNGMRQVISRNGIYRNSEDLRGQKIRIPQNELNIMMWQAMGANPTPMSWGEVVTSLALGTIDALDHALGVFNDFNLHEIAPYITLTNHSSSPFPIIVSLAWLQSLPPDMRALFEEGVRLAAAQQRDEERGLEAGYLDRFEAAGVEIYELTPAEVAAFQESVIPVYDEWRSRVGDGLIDAWLATRP